MIEGQLEVMAGTGVRKGTGVYEREDNDEHGNEGDNERKRGRE